jgi:hypothetical protein
MESRRVSNLRKWFSGQKDFELSFDDRWKIILVGIADRVADWVDEEGGFRNRGMRKSKSYFYDLEKIVSADNIDIDRPTIRKTAQYLVKNNWGTLKAGSLKQIALTPEGYEKAEEILDEIFNQEPSDRSSWSYGLEEDLHDWLLVHGYRAFAVGKPFSDGGMINFREIANQHARHITDNQLISALSDLEFKDMIQRDDGPSKGDFWANFNSGGEVAAKLLEQIWEMRAKLPAADRFVRLNDNLPSFEMAIASLETLIAEMREIRVNDWPEKEGMLVTARSIIEMIKTRYVNKTAILAAISSVVTFLMLKFAEAPISDVANKAWATVKNLF